MMLGVSLFECFSSGGSNERRYDTTEDFSAVRQSSTDPLHLFESALSSNGGRSLFDDLLVPPLNGAVSSEKRNGISVFVSENLNLEVPRMLSQLHDEDGRAGDFGLHLRDDK